jgi:hypothetical protein
MGLVKRREKYLNMTEVVIHDEGVSSTNALARSEVKWIGFLTYTYYQGFLFLNTGNEINSGVAIDSRLMEEAQFAGLLTFVKKKLPEKKA